MLPTVMGDEQAEGPALNKAVYEALDNGLLILVNIKNHRVTYSIVNRPDPNTTPVSDHLLATALVEAGGKFKFKKGRPPPAESVERDDGNAVIYSQSIDIDWSDRIVESSMRKKRTLQVLSIVVQNLMASAMKDHHRRNPHGAN
jgi:hypothetical protein